MAKYNIKSVTNQKIVTVVKTQANKTNPYSMINLEADEKAMKLLSPYGFLLFNYIRNNQNNYCFGLSRKDFCEKTGVSRNSYLKAVKELEENSYLIKRTSNSNRYTFYENPSDSITDCENYRPDDKDIETAEMWIDRVVNGYVSIEELPIALSLDGDYSEEFIDYILSESEKLMIG